MTVHKMRTWLVAGLLLSTTSTAARGQVNEWVDTPAHDLQFFSPADLDFENQPLRRADGFIFRYDKLSWAFTGERNVIGSTGDSDASYNPWRVFQSGRGLDIDPDGLVDHRRKRREDATAEGDQHVGEDVPGGIRHLRYFRWRPKRTFRHTRITTKSEKTKAA